MTPRFLVPAEEEMLEAANFYEGQSIGLGTRYLDEVEGCVELLLDRPHIIGGALVTGLEGMTANCNGPQ